MKPLSENEGNTVIGIDDYFLEKSEIELVKKASRAFAVGYVNNLFNTIKTNNPSLVRKLKITNEYPYYLTLFIHQKTPGEIDELVIYAEPKNNGDGLCEVKEIHHSYECHSMFLKEKEKSLASGCIRWRWNSLEIPEMYMKAIAEGKRAGRTICDYSIFSSKAPCPKSFLQYRDTISFTSHPFWNPTKPQGLI